MGDRATLEKIYAIMRRLLLIKLDGLNPIPRKGTTRRECYRALYEIQELLETRRYFWKHLPQTNADRLRSMSDEQRQEFMQKMQAQMGEMQEKMQAMQEARKAYEKELEGFLDKDQLKAYRKDRRRQEAEMQRRMQGGMGGGRPGGMGPGGPGGFPGGGMGGPGGFPGGGGFGGF